jgi:hypothetical protein
MFLPSGIINNLIITPFKKFNTVFKDIYKKSSPAYAEPPPDTCFFIAAVRSSKPTTNKLP